MTAVVVGLAVLLVLAVAVVAWLSREVKALRILLDEAWARHEDD